MTTLAGVMVLVPSVSCLPEPSDQRLPSPFPYTKAWTAMTTDIDLSASPVAGVDTHTDTHTVATVTATGRHLATETFPTTRAGYTHLTEFLNKHRRSRRNQLFRCRTNPAPDRPWLHSR